MYIRTAYIDTEFLLEICQLYNVRLKRCFAVCILDRATHGASHTDADGGRLMQTQRFVARS